MTGRTAYRGQPLLVLSLILIGWVGMRVMTWQSPITYPASLAGFAQGTVVDQVAAKTDPDADGADGRSAMQASALTTSAVSAQPERASTKAPAAPVFEPRMLPPAATTQQEDLWEPAPAPPEPEIAPVSYWQVSVLQPTATQPVPSASSPPPVPTRIAAGHQILMAAAFSNMALPADTRAAVEKAKVVKAGETHLATRSASASAPVAAEAASDRWSIDGWLLLRSDDTSSLAGLEPSYGRSQAGAVLRYNLDPASSFRPQAYARATGALSGVEQLDFAGGLSARLSDSIPLRFAAEMRASKQSGSWEARPAVFAVTELPMAKLPFELRGEAYAQAGYVGGDFATAFVDGQLRVDRKLTDLGDTQLRIGAASWGGAQKDAARLDIGPTASLSFKLGDGRARLSADYRMRVAGDAQPNSGPAITLTAGF